MSELRWNPLLGEWVITATHRQDRTFKPPKDFCPLCPTLPGKFPTEVPAPDYDIVVFENKFPSLRKSPDVPIVDSGDLYKVDLNKGVCEVVLYTSDHESTLTRQSVSHIYKLIQVWTERYVDLGSRPYIKYVFIFENKGDVIGVTLAHPHGQIYAFPFIPPKIAAELGNAGRHFRKTGRCLVCDVVKAERGDGRRIVAENKSFSAIIPFYARYPYEVHIFARGHLESLAKMSDAVKWDLAQILKIVLEKFDNLFGLSFPYMMVFHQAPTDGGECPHYHFHIEFYPPLRTSDKLKYLAGCESGAGTFINDTAAEEKARELRDLKPASPEELNFGL